MYVCMYVHMCMYVCMYVCTENWEIFIVKIFSWLAQPTKIYHTKYFTNE